MDLVTTNRILGLSLQGGQFSLVGMEGGRIQAIASHELVQPFNLEILREGNGIIESHVDAIKNLYRKMDAKGNGVGVSIHGGMVLIKRVPSALGLEDKGVHEQMEWEAEQIVVSPLKDYTLVYQRLPFQTSAGNPLYLLVLIRKRVVNLIRQLVESADLSLRELDVDVFSDIRTLLANYDIDAKETVVLVDIQKQSLVFIFIRQREYFLSHRVSYKENGARSESGDISEIVKILLKELRRLIFGHRLGREIDDMNRIFLLGNEKIRPIFHELTSQIDVPLEVLNPFQRVVISQEVTQMKEYLKSPEIFIASIGVALKQSQSLVA